jgi:hypothetical protein
VAQLRAEPDAPASQERADARRRAPAAAAAPAPQAAAPAPAWESNPRDWLRHIEMLLKDHRLDEARASLKAFRSRYPDYPLPADFPLREP